MPKAAHAAMIEPDPTPQGPTRPKILPRSILGLASLILSFSIGAGFSGVILYSYYQFKLDKATTAVNKLENTYKDQFAKAEGDLAAAVATAKSDIANQLKAVQQLQVDPTSVATLTKQMAPSVFFVHTLDANGQPSVGSAFVVASTSSQSYLVTSYTTVEAATHSPGPTVYVRQGTTDTKVTVRNWDPTYDLAVLVLSKGGLTPLVAAPTSPGPQPGDRLFAVSGLGTAGASLSQAAVLDASSSGLVVGAALGQEFQGGPIVNQSGQVVAVASRTYAPLGFTSDGAWFAPYVESACAKVLSCPGGTLAGSS